MKQSWLRWRGILLLTLGGLWPAWPCPAAMALQVRPLSESISATSAATFQFGLQLINRVGSEAITVELAAMDVVQQSDQSERYAAAGSTPYSCAGWLTLPAGPVALSPGQQQEVTVRGAVPANARGTHHAVIIIRASRPPAGSATAPTQVTMGIGYAFPVDVAVAGTCVEEANITELALDRTASAAGLPQARVRLGVANTGDAMLQLRGYLYLRDVEHGALLQRLPLSSGGGLRLLPGSRCTRWIDLPQQLGRGKYGLQVRATFGADQRELSATREFVVGPDNQIAAAGGPLRTLLQRLDLQLQPHQIDVALSRGAVTLRRVSVRNDTDRPMRCRVSVTPFTTDPEGEIVERPEDPSAQLEVHPEVLDLAPHSAAPVALRVATGADVERSREHYWQVRVVEQAADGGTGPMAVAVGRATVVGADSRAVTPARPELRSVEARQGLAATTLRFVLANAGGRAFSLRGQLVLRVGTDSRPAVLLNVAPPVETVVLADSERQWSVTVPEAVPPQSWHGELQLDLGASRVVTLPFTVAPPSRNGSAGAK